MSQLDRLGPEVILAVVVAVWFLVTGVAKLVARPAAAGRRAVSAEPGWQVAARRVRGALEVLGGLAAAADGAITLLALRFPFPGLAVGLALAALAGWTVVDNARPPVRWVQLILAVLGFALAVFFAGFRD